MLKNTIKNNWDNDFTGKIQKIAYSQDMNFPAWTIKPDGQVGVIIPYSGYEDIYEESAGTKIQSLVYELEQGKSQRVLQLTSVLNDSSFATLCEAFVDPGENGKIRQKIDESPLEWWREWTDLLGNKNIDERIYDVLGELCALFYVVKNGEDANWNGPNGASYDIETETRFVEVKSTINRSKKEVTINNQHQLFPTKKPLDLVLCVFEPVIDSGVSIDGILSEFENIGFDTDILNEKLESLNFKKGMSLRKKQFMLHEMLLYGVDETFPRISPESFVGGTLPKEITKITYTVDFSGREAISLMQGETNNV